MKSARDAFIKACKNCNFKRAKGPFHTYTISNQALAFYLDFQKMRSGDMWDINIGINRLESIDDNMCTMHSEFQMRFQGLVDFKSLELDIFLVIESDDESFFKYCVQVFQENLIYPLNNLKSVEDLRNFSKLNPRHMMKKELRSFFTSLD